MENFDQLFNKSRSFRAKEDGTLDCSIMNSKWLKDISTLKKNEVSHRIKILEDEINTKISEVITYFSEYDRVRLLASISRFCSIANAKEYTEYTQGGRDKYLEYAQSLALTVETSNNVRPTRLICEKLLTILIEIVDDINVYYLLKEHTIENYTSADEIRHSAISHFIHVRGDAFPVHYNQMILDLFCKFNPVLTSYFHLTVEEMIESINTIINKANDKIRYSNFSADSQKFVDLEVELNAILDVIDAVYPSSKNEQFLNFLSDALGYHEIMIECDFNLLVDIFEIVPESKEQVVFFEKLSSTFGCNCEFNDDLNRRWYMGNSIIYEKPLITYGGKFYCFNYNLLYLNLLGIIENVIEQQNEKSYQKYKIRRSKYLENKAMDYLGHIFKNTLIYRNLFYEAEKGLLKEIDGLIVFDTTLLLIEAKSGSVSLSAKRGSLKRLKKAIDTLMNEPYKQSSSAKNYILNSPSPLFYYKNGKKALEMKNVAQFRNIYLINVTFENVPFLATKLNCLSNAGLLKAKEWVWSVYINDLQIISDIIEFPTEFIFYLQKRLIANEREYFLAADEPDYFMYFLKSSLFLPKKQEKDKALLLPLGITDELNNYYNRKDVFNLPIKKPTFEIPDTFKQLLIEIEHTKKRGFSDLVLYLLELPGGFQNEINKWIIELINKSNQDGECHDVSPYYPEQKEGLTLTVSPYPEKEFTVDEYFIDLKLYQRRYERWYVIFIKLKNHEWTLDFSIYNKKWRYSPEMEVRLMEFKDKLWAKFIESGKRLSDDMPCPCNSALMYKDCCKKMK